MRDPIFSLCEEVPLTPPELHALSLGEDGPIAGGELARRPGVAGSAIPGVVARPAGETYLERVRNEADRRSVLFRRTARGAGVVRRLDRRLRAKLELFLAALRRGDRWALRRIPRALARPAAPAGPRASRRGAARRTAARRVSPRARPRPGGPPRSLTVRTHSHPREDR